MEKSFAMRSFVFFTGFLVTVAASADLPLLPALEYSARPHAPGTHYSQIMRPLIRVHFGDQVRWRPFLQRDEHSGALHAHHRVVREYRSRRSPHSTHPTSIVNADSEMRTQPVHTPAARHYHLRGNLPPPSSLVPHPQTLVEPTTQSSEQDIVVELANSQ